MFPNPVTEVAISPRSQHDEEKLSTALQRILEEDPTLRVDRRAETGETVLAGLGDTHIDVTIARIHRKFGVDVETALPSIPYRETITATADAEGKHKKQTGGRGQFAVANVKFMPPSPRLAATSTSTASRAVRSPARSSRPSNKGIQEALERGVLAGYPVDRHRRRGIRWEVPRRRLRRAVAFAWRGSSRFERRSRACSPVLLEPIMHLTIRVPEDHTGDVMGDINSKRGRVMGIDSDGGSRVIEAEIPMSEVQRYAADLRSMTSGRGTFEIRFDHYAEVPHQEAQKVIAASQRQKTERTRWQTHVLRYGDRELTLPVVTGTRGRSRARHQPSCGRDRTLHARSRLRQYRRGPERCHLHRRRRKGILRHRGYPIEQLAEQRLLPRSGLPLDLRRASDQDGVGGFRSRGDLVTPCSART